MVELIAIIRRKKASATKEELARIGCPGYSVFPVLGRGRQRGLKGESGGEGFAFLPKVLFDLVVEQEHAQEMIEAIIRANQTGEFGDGKIFVIEAAETYRISTGLPAEASAQAGDGEP
jgi:nitrogen regulatory protein PII